MKKRYLLVALLLVVAFSLGAQQAGDILIGGASDLGLGTELFLDDGEWIDSYLDIDIWGGYFVATGIEIGPSIGFYFGPDRLKGTEQTYSETDLTFGVQAGFFFPTGSQIVPFVRPEVAYYRYSEVAKNGGTVLFEDSYSGLRARLYGGIDIMLNEFVALSAGARYTFYWDEFEFTYHWIKAFLGFDIFLSM